MKIIPTMIAKNTASVRFYALPAEHGIRIPALQARAIADIKDLMKDPIEGFVAPQHLLARDLTDDTCSFGEFLFFSLARYARKVNAKLLESRVHEEQEREEKARGVDRLPRAAAKEIAKQVEEALLVTAQPSVSGVHACVCDSRSTMMATAVSDRDHDLLFNALANATADSIKTIPVGLYPDVLMRLKCGIAASELPPIPFFVEGTDIDIGAEFLTWLWWRFETRGGAVETASGLHFGYCINGPLRFSGTPGVGHGSDKVVISDGIPTAAPEAFDALINGKMLAGCLFGMAIGDDVFRATVSSDFAFRSLKVPKPTEFDGPADIVFQRTRAMFAFWDAWCALFSEFAAGRFTAPEWGATVKEIKSWVMTRYNALKG